MITIRGASGVLHLARALVTRDGKTGTARTYCGHVLDGELFDNAPLAGSCDYCMELAGKAAMRGETLCRS